MRDTSLKAEALQAEIHGKLPACERLCLAFEMSMATREMSLARLRQQHPEWSEARLKREVLRYSFLPDPLPSVLL